MKISKSIKRLRESKNLTQEQFGKIAGVSSMAVSQWENGRAVPRMGAIQKLSDFFGVPKSEIMGDVPELSSLRRLAELESTAYNDYTTDEYELIHLFRLMDEQGKEHVMETARMCAALSEKSETRNAEGVARIGEPVR